VVTGGKTSFILACGLAGGDVYTIEGGVEKGKPEATHKVITWRKAWYQVTREKSLVLPALTNFISAYELAFVGMERTKDKSSKRPLRLREHSIRNGWFRLGEPTRKWRSLEATIKPTIRPC
jgi:hypothetical protein